MADRAGWRRSLAGLLARGTDAAWARFGEDDPYYGVLSDDRFRAGRLDPAAREEFFASGEAQAEAMLGVVRERLDPLFRPTRALDFGCGVGRVTLPLARRCAEVVGVDVSPGMLREAARNADAAGLRNVALVRSDDALSAVPGSFDLVHSYIVFQHVPPRRGEAVLRALVERLRPGGVGILHFTYRRRASAARRALQRLRARVPLAHACANLAAGKPAGLPHMEMNEYDLSRIFAVLQDGGCHLVHPRFTDHGGHRGVVLFFSRRELPLL